MMLTQKNILSVVLALVVTVLLLVPFATVHAQAPEMINTMVQSETMPSAYTGADTDEMSTQTHLGPVFAGKMLHAWIALIAGILIIIVASFMRGGQLMWPILLIGVGALADAAIGLIPAPGEHLQVMWIAVLVFNSSVVLAVIWIARIFGIFGNRS